MLRQVRDVAVRPDPRNDAANHAAHDDSRVVQRLVDAELDVVLAEEHGVAAHEGDGGLGGDAGAGGALGEGHGDRAAGEGVV